MKKMTKKHNQQQCKECLNFQSKEMERDIRIP